MLESAYEFVALDVANAALYENLTYPSFRPLLQGLIPNGSTIAVGVRFLLSPVGLVLTKCDGNGGEVLSLFVVPEHRHRGLGKALLSYAERELYRRGCLYASLVYMPNKTTLALEQILASCGWSTPKPRMLVGLNTYMSIENTPLVGVIKNCLNRYCLPASFAIFPWLELTLAERETIENQQGTFGWHPEFLSPFNEEDILEPCNSLGLRYQEQVVGWIITHRVTVNTVRYTSLFVRQDLQRLGRAIPLMFTAFLLQLKIKDATKAIFTVRADNAAMLRFVHKRIAPNLASIRQSMETSKLLNASVLSQ
ncbi:MAG: GNAT family N-acetyltransferase [Nostoc indistinguendum CM1-VF10]|jgi:GNAT superfamily N-acetyltransferase|nr:GNAT family N-acetyltransferase [Nostoc indistinguendum CM1-VF10]